MRVLFTERFFVIKNTQEEFRIKRLRLERKRVNRERPEARNGGPGAMQDLWPVRKARLGNVDSSGKKTKMDAR